MQKLLSSRHATSFLPLYKQPTTYSLNDKVSSQYSQDLHYFNTRSSKWLKFQRKPTPRSRRKFWLNHLRKMWTRTFQADYNHQDSPKYSREQCSHLIACSTTWCWYHQGRCVANLPLTEFCKQMLIFAPQRSSIAPLLPRYSHRTLNLSL